MKKELQTIHCWSPNEKGGQPMIMTTAKTIMHNACFFGKKLSKSNKESDEPQKKDKLAERLQKILCKKTKWML